MIRLFRGAFYCLLLLSNVAFGATEIVLEYTKGPTWEMDGALARPFEQFLMEEKKRLLGRVQGLSLSENPSDLAQVIKEINSANPEYANRAVACRFLQKIRTNLVSRIDLDEFNRITSHGKVCIAGDLHASAQASWSLDLAQFFWLRSWIKRNGKEYSLKSWLDHKIGASVPTSVPLLSIRSQLIEGYAFGFSPADQNFISRHTRLADMFAQAKAMDFDDPKTYPNYGAEVDELFKMGPGFAGMLIVPPTMALSYGLSPFDLIELTAHEYGHIVHHYNQTVLEERGSTIRMHLDQVWNEGVAEAFAWVGLEDLDEIYPEIRFFHIVKLINFGRFRPQDPHYRGAVGFARFFHNRNASSVHENLRKFMLASSLSDFMSEVGFFPFVKKADAEYMPIRFVWGLGSVPRKNLIEVHRTCHDMTILTHESL